MRPFFTTLLLLASLATAFSQGLNNPLAIPPILQGNYFQLDVRMDTTEFYPGVRTPTYGFNGSYLGPTLVMQKDDSVHITINNGLNRETSVHWHGMHVPSEFDGGPWSPIPSGESFLASYKVLNAASLCWYHPHLHGSTATQVNFGLAGLIYVRDNVESQLPLPRTYGVDDIPLVLQDRSFDMDGGFSIDQMDPLGDSMLVNGTPRPYVDCPAQVVRLRILNGSNSRVYYLGFDDNRPFSVIASDDGLLDAPVSVTRLMVTNGERFEILVDMSGELGQDLILRCYGTELANHVPGAVNGGMNGNSPLNDADFDIIRLHGVAPTAGAITQIPPTLIVNQPWDVADADRTRVKTMAGNGMAGMGAFTINGMTYDMMTINDTIQLNDIEVWEFVNTTNLSHPMHIHDVPFYMLTRNGVAVPAYERGLKDVFMIAPNESVRFITKFENFTTDGIPYMYHCHNLWHEDNNMMAQFFVVDTLTNVPASANNIYNMTITPNPSSTGWTLKGRWAGIPSFALACVCVYDAQGRFVSKQMIHVYGRDFEVFVENANLPDGVYVLKVEGDGKSVHVKAVK